MRFEKDTGYDPYAFLGEDPEKAKKTKDIAMLVIVILGVTGGIIASRFSKAATAVVLGVMFLLVGITMSVYNKKIKAYPEQWLRPITVVLTGLALTLLTVFGKSSFGDEHFMMLMISLAIFALLIGGLLIFSPFFEAAMKKRRCTDTVMATCVDTKVRMTGRGGRWYEHIWEYPRGSIKVRTSDHIVVSTEKPYVGSVEQIAVNPDDPNDIYRRTPSRTAFMVLSGSIVLFIGIVLSVMMTILLTH